MYKAKSTRYAKVAYICDLWRHEINRKCIANTMHTAVIANLKIDLFTRFATFISKFGNSFAIKVIANDVFANWIAKFAKCSHGLRHKSQITYAQSFAGLRYTFETLCFVIEIYWASRDWSLLFVIDVKDLNSTFTTLADSDFTGCGRRGRQKRFTVCFGGLQIQIIMSLSKLC